MSILKAVLLLGVLGTLTEVGTPMVTFDAHGPGGLKLQGVTHEATLKDDGKRISVTVPLAGLDTGIDLRNRHMREKYLQVDRFPDATLVVPWSALQVPANGQSLEAKADGQLTLHGVTRAVRFAYQAKRAGPRIDVTGTLPLNISDYGIQRPSFLGVTVQPDIITHIQLTATLR